MSNKSVLEHVAYIVKSQHPGLSAEAIVSFLIILDLGEPTVAQVANMVGMTEPKLFQHLSMLTTSGGGLIQLINNGDGSNSVRLTARGQQLRAQVASSFSD
ncbi:MAG: hypothetical protein EP335_00525 [Alphaproteobacteria bacterium]|nr:MAG: hypothetical protein EP335_00525 [Alphaproteobacteria bacterium]